MDKKKKNLLLVLLCLLVLTAGIVWYFLSPAKEEIVEKVEEEKPTYAEHVVSYNESGAVSLYQTETGKKIDSIDLKSKVLNPKIAKDQEEDCLCVPPSSVKTEESKVKEKVEQSIQTDKKESTTILYKGFEMVSKPIPKGSHVWGVQSELTPHINTVKMLPLLREINKGQSLHPVQPNEIRIFLQEPKEKPSEAPVIVPVEVPVVKETPKKTIADATYIFHTDQKDEKVYAYSDLTDEVYQITIKDAKLHVEIIATVSSEQESIWLFVDKENLWIADKEKRHIQVFDLQEPEKLIEWDTKGIMSEWFVQGTTLHYAYDNRIAYEELGKGILKDVVLGDTTVDFVKIDDKFYVLNSFGNKSDNSLLMKVNPKDLVVDDLIEMKSNQTAILSYGDEGTLYVGKIEKTKGLDGTLLEEPKVVSIDVTKDYLSEKSMKWEIIFKDSMQGYNKHLYALEDKLLTVYPTGDTETVIEFKIEQNSFSLLP